MVTTHVQLYLQDPFLCRDAAQGASSCGPFQQAFYFEVKWTTWVPTLVSFLHPTTREYHPSPLGWTVDEVTTYVLAKRLHVAVNLVEQPSGAEP